MKRDILHNIEENMDGFSKGQRQIARYLLAHYDKAAYMTAAKLGSEVSVSESTVVRFVMELGYAGYPEFQRALQELIRTKLTSFQRMEVTNHLIGDGDVLEKVLQANVENIRHTLDGVSRSAFHDAVEAIVNAKNVYIIGVRSSAMLANFLSYSLQMIFDNVRLIETTAGSELFQQMMSVGEGDVMVAISFPRYSKRVIKAVEFARRAGADVVALTDSPESPIAPAAAQLLIAQSDMASYVDSLVAPLSLINAIVVAVSRAREDDVRKRLETLEHIWDEYDVYDKNQG
ncbi:MAG: MurR/RpiR family transcriptional regulator [Clostridia bacterium]|nr:MurR/RpiR family transcriptional regulator [Clostridia bacterium]MBQ5724574.1 MurR/RpiR family transcriptional regulator [Clostridia bacterium]